MFWFELVADGTHLQLRNSGDAKNGVSLHPHVGMDPQLIGDWEFVTNRCLGME
jgi:hypothetical protein